MGIFSFFKKPQSSPNIFIDVGKTRKLETKSGQIDYILSRSLYASIPTQDISYYDYALGNYATKTYIDTLSSFVSIPRVAGGDDVFNTLVNKFLENNKSILIKIYRQAMIDGVVYVWCRIEKNIKGEFQLILKIVPRENVVLSESIKNTNGYFDKIVFKSVETWKEKKTTDSWGLPLKYDEGIHYEEQNNKEDLIEKKATVKITIYPYKEEIKIIGDLPPQYKVKEKEQNTFVSFVPIFAFYNNQFSFLSDGVPEIANVLPFIKKYNATFRLLERHLSQILDPKIKLNLKSAKAFLKNNLGIKESDYEAIERGELKPDVTQFKAAILTGDNEDVSFVNQENNLKSALDMLSLIHWIIIEMTMPEYLYGTALNTTNASVKEQSPVWIKKIEDRRTEYTQFYIWLIEVFIKISNNFFNKNIDEKIPYVIEWEELETKDNVALMQALHSATESILKTLNAGLISPETAFNALKTFITIPEEYKSEHEKAIEYIREKSRLEAEEKQLNNAGFSSFI